VGSAYASDTRLGQEALAQLEGSGPLLADSGFDGGEVEEKGLEPHIPLKGGGKVRDERRKRAKRVFSSALYRLRAAGAIRGIENEAGLWFPSGDLTSYGPEAGPLGGGGLQPPGVPHPLFAFTLGSSGLSSLGPSISKTSPRCNRPRHRDPP